MQDRIAGAVIKWYALPWGVRAAAKLAVLGYGSLGLYAGLCAVLAACGLTH